MITRNYLLRGLVLWASLLASGSLFADAGDVPRTGKAIYEDLCVRCHGPQGEGVADKYDETLYGDRSLASLTRLIERTMPEEDPDKCVGEDAALVADYIFNAFYSPAARARMNPPKIDLARLTADQYINTIPDLLGSFRNQPRMGEDRGLHAQYFKTRKFSGEDRVAEQVDPTLNFDFGEGTPEFPEMKAEEFSIRWNGSLIADETGDYEFSITTANGVRLFLNDFETRFIDAWVSSGNEPREERATMRLIGGRAYPIRLDFFKFKEKTASIVLKWKPPHKAWEVIPNRYLSPQSVPKVFVVGTSLPPDDASTGYPRGTAVSPQWDQATSYAAIEVAAYVLENLESLAGVKQEADDREEKLKAFCARFAEKAFRRPLTEEDIAFFIDSQFQDASDLDLAVKRTVLLVLKSPRFLYPELPKESPDHYDIASRISFALWDSMPDAELLQAASEGKLHDPAIVQSQIARMVPDPRTRTKVRDFLHHWLHTDEAEDLSRDPEAYPDFSDAVLSDMRTSLDLFLDEVVWGDKPNYQDLLLADYLYLNERLAKFLGSEEAFASAESDNAIEGFRKVKVDPAMRTGVLTHPYLLTALAYFKSSSPIHRGVFLSRNIVGRALKPPPMAIQFMDGRFDPSFTMREKVTELTRDNACMNCHSIINPLGFSLEHYDAVGRFRTMDNSKPVNPVSDYTTSEGEALRITGPRDVAEHAAGSEDAHSGFVRQLFQQMVKQPPAAYGPDTLEQLRKSFADSNFDIRKLVGDIVHRAALHSPDETDQMASTQK